jgi:hypothetical protein
MCSGCRRAVRGGVVQHGPRLAATDLAWGPRARDEATRSCRFPGLLRFGFSYRRGSRRGRFGRFNSGRRGFRPFGGSGLLVLLETAVFVFTARAAIAGLVAPRWCTGRSRHSEECTLESFRRHVVAEVEVDLAQRAAEIAERAADRPFRRRRPALRATRELPERYWQPLSFRLSAISAISARDSL